MCHSNLIAQAEKQPFFAPSQILTQDQSGHSLTNLIPTFFIEKAAY